MIATEAQIKQLRAHAVNAITNEIAANGITLTHAQADDLGEEVMNWMQGRLMLDVVETDRGTICTPPKHYTGGAVTDECIVDAITLSPILEGG